MKKLVLLFGVLFAFSIAFPNGISLNSSKEVVEPREVDLKIVSLLKDATPEDKGRVASIYDGVRVVLSRDVEKNLNRINTTEKWAELQSRTLELAVDQVGKYPGLDTAIEDVFMRVVGSDDVLPVNPETHQKLLKACEIIANSAR
jgi:hypothetical protein